MPETARISMSHFVRAVLRGVGQIVFQECLFTGLFFLAGIAIDHPGMAVSGLIATLIGTVVAIVLRFDRAETLAGIYGFNAALVGFAALFFLQGTVGAWGLMALGAVVSTIVCRVMRMAPFPTYTAPFIVTTWGMLALARGFQVPFVAAGAPVQPITPVDFLGLVQEAAAGLSEIMFEAGVLTGVLFLVGIAISNWRHAVLALVGSLLGTLMSHYHDDPQQAISIGIYGYNAALAAVAVYLWRPSWIGAALGAILSVPMTEFFPSALAPLTAPFVLASWAVLILGGIVDPRFTPRSKPAA